MRMAKHASPIFNSRQVRNLQTEIRVGAYLPPPGSSLKSLRSVVEKTETVGRSGLEGCLLEYAVQPHRCAR
jgi:hypothetical protein